MDHRTGRRAFRPNDLEQATKVAHSMVTRFGMSRLGQTYLTENNIGNKDDYADMNIKVEREVYLIREDIL